MCGNVAKGRTNIELREQFILADGVSQSMAAFKPRVSNSNGNSPSPVPTQGPIMKVIFCKKYKRKKNGKLGHMLIKWHKIYLRKLPLEEIFLLRVNSSFVGQKINKNNDSINRNSKYVF